jgi:predicted peptidase
MDIKRVGIHGHSGGGFMSTAAMLVYPDFFKVAVSSAGNHENNIYNRWWSEKHHGVREQITDKGDTTFLYAIEKNSELDESDPNRKFKGRVVFEGCYVKDEDNNWAIFSEIASCPASMEASRAADAFGMLPGHGIEIADGESAYTQAKLGGDLTY